MLFNQLARTTTRRARRLVVLCLFLISFLVPAGFIGDGRGGRVLADTPEPTPTPPTRSLPHIVANGPHLRDSASWQPFEVRGINYIRPFSFDPEQCPEIRFVDNTDCPWDSAAIEADMERLGQLGVNTVRVFLNFYEFGGTTILPLPPDEVDHTLSPDSIEAALDHLEELITIANRYHIYVMPVLMAKYPQDTHFAPEDFWQTMDAHVRPILKRFGNRPGIFAWDLFNEPDIAGPLDPRCWDWDNSSFALCFGAAQQRLLFLNMLRDEVRKLDPHRLLTVSVAFAKSYFRPYGAYSVRLADLVDFYSFHYFDNDPFDAGRYAQHWYYGEGFPRDLERSIDELTGLNLHKVVVISEIGFPSGEGTLRQLEEAQRDIRTVVDISRSRPVSGIILWPFQPEPEDMLRGLF